MGIKRRRIRSPRRTHPEQLPTPNLKLRRRTPKGTHPPHANFYSPIFKIPNPEDGALPRSRKRQIKIGNRTPTPYSRPPLVPSPHPVRQHLALPKPRGDRRARCGRPQGSRPPPSTPLPRRGGPASASPVASRSLRAGGIRSLASLRAFHLLGLRSLRSLQAHHGPRVHNSPHQTRASARAAQGPAAPNPSPQKARRGARPLHPFRLVCSLRSLFTPHLRHPPTSPSPVTAPRRPPRGAESDATPAHHHPRKKKKKSNDGRERGGCAGRERAKFIFNTAPRPHRLHSTSWQR